MIGENRFGDQKKNYLGGEQGRDKKGEAREKSLQR